MNNSDKKFMQVAKALAKTSTYKRNKIGCVVVYNKTVISMGTNTNKTHTQQFICNYKKFNPAYNKNCVIPKAHAEVIALSKIRYMDIDWKKVRIYVFRDTKDGYLLARPCVACMSLIKQLGIHKIFYSTYESFIEEEII